jgi:uncharacterized protein (DUF1015 family)
MNEVIPFNALRYSRNAVRNMSKVVSLPYDVIDSDMQDDYYNSSKYNIVRVILRKKDKSDVYKSAAKEFNNWINKGILVKDKVPAYYILEQEYKYNGDKKKRTGIFGLVKLKEFESRDILPHEETFKSHKNDRFKLLTECKANLSPIFGLYNGENPSLQAEKKFLFEFNLKDNWGITKSSVYSISGETSIASINGYFKDKKIFIADGHHRYESALEYKKRMPKKAQEDPGVLWNYIMFCLVSFEDSGLLVLPTHRVVRFKESMSLEAALDKISPYFNVDKDKSPNSNSIVMYRDNTYFRLTPKSNAFAGSKEKRSNAWKNFPTSILHYVILPRLPITVDIVYTRDMKEVIDLTDKKDYDLGFILPPVENGSVREISSKLEKMPQKSTYFYPKMPVGALFNKI